MTAGVRPVVAGLAGAAAMIALVNMASRIVGFGRWVAQASEVGAEGLGGAYAAANTLPNVLFEVAAGGALAGAVVPLLAVPLSRAVRSDVDRISSALLGWALAVLVPLAVAVALLARPLVSPFLERAGESETDVAAMFLAIFAVQIPLYGVGVVLTGVLQAHRRFFWPAIAPLLSSVVVIGVYLVFGRMVPDPTVDPGTMPQGALTWLAWGTTAGVAVMSLVLLWPVHRTGVRLRPTIRFPPGVARRARHLALAGLGALLAQQASVVVTLYLADAHGEAGTFAVFQFVQAVYFLPYAVLVVPLATATFPRLAEHAARDDRAGFARLASSTTRTVLLGAGMGAAALVAVAPAVEQAFVSFTSGDVTGMGPALAVMAPGVLGFALIIQLSRALYALHHGRTAVTATAAGWLAVAVAALVGVPLLTPGRGDQTMTLVGLAGAGTVGMTVAGVGLVIGLARAAGSAAVQGVARTVLVLAAGGAGGAAAGRRVVGSLLEAGDGRTFTGLGGALLAGLAGAVVAALVVIVLARLVDPGSLHGVRVGRATAASSGAAQDGATPAGAAGETSPEGGVGPTGPDRTEP